MKDLLALSSRLTNNSMSKFAQKTEAVSNEWKPSRTEAMALAEKLKGYTPTVVNGRKQWPLELHMEKSGMISFDPFGRIQVKNPFLYRQTLHINGLREWIEEQEMEGLFQQFPEEREIHQGKIQAMIAEIKQMLRGFSAGVL